MHPDSVRQASWHRLKHPISSPTHYHFTKFLRHSQRCPPPTSSFPTAISLHHSPSAYSQLPGLSRPQGCTKLFSCLPPGNFTNKKKMFISWLVYYGLPPSRDYSLYECRKRICPFWYSIPRAKLGTEQASANVWG